LLTTNRRANVTGTGHLPGCAEAGASGSAKARLVPASDVAQALHDPDWLRTESPEHPWIRVGVAGEWGFALDESMAGFGGYEDAAVAALAAGTDVVLFTHTQTIDDFR
jgi:hypothetical protein